MTFTLAIVGRPNSGKSTLINRMLGEDRLITGPEAGITRDSIAIDWEWQGRQVRLIDTAGMRKRAKVQDKLEKLSVADALHAVDFAEVVVPFMAGIYLIIAIVVLFANASEIPSVFGTIFRSAFDKEAA